MYLIWRGAVIERRDGFRAGDFLSISNEHKRFYIQFPHTKWRFSTVTIPCIYTILIEVSL